MQGGPTLHPKGSRLVQQCQQSGSQRLVVLDRKTHEKTLLPLAGFMQNVATRRSLSTIRAVHSVLL